ncbi:MAG: hypothetical protein KOO60_12230 [Gemmatimonadales bacterium]|nr:hypothetical protein [Gemmatimonadales bacterium]
MKKFRKVCRWLHREAGFLAVGLTLVYAISGIAINHAHHWDANYSRTEEVLQIEPVGILPTAEAEPLVLDRLGITIPVKGIWRDSETLLQIFLDGVQYDVNLESGRVIRQGFAKRPLLYDVNFMHLNSGKKIWTVIADTYAGILILLALTGIFLVKGRKGLSGRGGVTMALGVVLPVVYAVLIRIQ